MDKFLIYLFPIYQIEIGQQMAENDASLQEDAELTCDGWDRDPAWPYIRKFPTVVIHYDLDSELSKTQVHFGLGINIDTDIDTDNRIIVCTVFGTSPLDLRWAIIPKLLRTKITRDKIKLLRTKITTDKNYYGQKLIRTPAPNIMGVYSN